MEKAIYKVVSMRYGTEHGFYNFVNEKYEEEFSNFEDAKEVYNDCIEQAKSSDNYAYLRGGTTRMIAFHYQKMVKSSNKLITKSKILNIGTCPKFLRMKKWNGH